MKKYIFTLFLILLAGMTACSRGPRDRSGPEIEDIQTSGNVLVISDCAGTTVTISARVTDPSGVKNVRLWYRTGSDPKFSSIAMELQNGNYTGVLNGPDFLGRPYGILAFYITAEDEVGNSSQSPVNQSIQFLPCVNN